MEHQNNIVFTSKTGEGSHETFCLNELMDEMKTYAEQELAKIGRSHVRVEIFKFYRTERYWVHTDRKCLRQIFVILLDNAVKHTDKGAIMFDYLISNLSPAQNDIRFFVDDTGYGKDDENEVNYSIAQGLVKKMGGELRIRPEGDSGTSIKFNILCAPFDLQEN
jgi:signal transduction histidine kinase